MFDPVRVEDTVSRRLEHLADYTWKSQCPLWVLRRRKEAERVMDACYDAMMDAQIVQNRFWLQEALKWHAKSLLNQELGGV